MSTKSSVSLPAKWPLLSSEINQLLLSGNIFSMLLLLVRVLYTGKITFVFLIWNLFLAFVPWLLSTTLMQQPSWMERKLIFLPLLAIWLLFIPNSFYILTDRFHLTWASNVPLWFDLLLILSFAWNALLMGILSVRHIEKIFESIFLFKNQWLFIYPVMFLNALGVYIGRYMRFNSWDVVTNPLQLLLDITNIILHPINHKNVWAMVLVYSIFMTLIYTTIKKISKSIW